MIEITVHCTPAPQGSKKHVGNGVMVEMSKALKPWRDAVCCAAIEAMGGAGRGIAGPVEVEMIFTVRKPASAPKRQRSWPDRKPDIDKLCRSTNDALVSAGAIEDDARIVSLLASKVFPGEHVSALEVPGAVIRIRRIV